MFEFEFDTVNDTTMNSSNFAFKNLEWRFSVRMYMNRIWDIWYLHKPERWIGHDDDDDEMMDDRMP